MITTRVEDEHPNMFTVKLWLPRASKIYLLSTSLVLRKIPVTQVLLNTCWNLN